MIAAGSHAALTIANMMGSIHPSYGGLPVSVRELSRHLRRWGHRPLYFTTTYGFDHESLPTSGEYGHVEWAPLATPRGWYRAPDLRARLSEHAATLDIIHNQGMWTYPQLLGARFAIETGKPLVITPHGALEPWRISAGFVKRWKKHAYLRTIGRDMLSNCRCLIALTEAEVEGYRRLGYDGDVAVIPNGVDASGPRFDSSALETLYARWPPLADRPWALFLSRLSGEKGLDLLLPAWARVVARLKEQTPLLVLAGPDDRGYGRRCRAMIEAYGLERRVLATGMVTGAVKAALVKRALFFTLPSYSEGFSMAVLESMAAALPVVITTGCHFPEVAAEGAGFVAEPKVESLVDAYISMLSMPAADRLVMGEKGRRLVERRYTWEVQARKLLTLYRHVRQGSAVPMHPEMAS